MGGEVESGAARFRVRRRVRRSINHLSAKLFRRLRAVGGTWKRTRHLYFPLSPFKSCKNAHLVFFFYKFLVLVIRLKPNRVSCYNIIIIIHLRLTKCLIIIPEHITQ